MRAAARHIHRIQKVLTQMNIQLANVLSDVSGMTGQAIIKAILAGQRDPHKLATFRDPRVKASEEQIQLLYTKRSSLDLYIQTYRDLSDCARIAASG
jgi:hypothetical protein